MTQVFYCSTFFGAMTLSAAIDADCFGPRDQRRLLIVSTNSATPEITRPLDQTPGFDGLRGRFDDVVSWNELIAPLHPSDWSPSASEAGMLARLMSASLGLADVSELILESVAVAPARTIALLIRDCPISVFSDGLMSYGPTRNGLPAEINGRLRRVLYLDLVDGLQPLLLREYGVCVEAVPDAAFTRVMTDLPPAPGAVDARGWPVILGQYLSAAAVDDHGGGGRTARRDAHGAGRARAPARRVQTAPGRRVDPGPPIAGDRRGAVGRTHRGRRDGDGRGLVPRCPSSTGRFVLFHGAAHRSALLPTPRRVDGVRSGVGAASPRTRTAIAFRPRSSTPWFRSCGRTDR